MRNVNSFKSGDFSTLQLNTVNNASNLKINNNYKKYVPIPEKNYNLYNTHNTTYNDNRFSSKYNNGIKII